MNRKRAVADRIVPRYSFEFVRTGLFACSALAIVANVEPMGLDAGPDQESCLDRVAYLYQ